jgi:hypothetical protein
MSNNYIVYEAGKGKKPAVVTRKVYEALRNTYAHDMIHKLQSLPSKEFLVGLYCYQFTENNCKNAVLCSRVYTKSCYNQIVANIKVDYPTAIFFSVFGDKL